MLASRAMRYAKKHSRTWIPLPIDYKKFDRPEIISYEFTSFANYMANDCGATALTDPERAFFHRLHQAWRFRRSRNAFHCQIAVQPEARR